jgi:hypothetical protein
MIPFKQINRLVFTMAVIILSVVTLSKCISEEDNRANKKNKISFSDFAGSASCMGCHKTTYEDHINTGHYQTSQPASGKNINGSFEQGHNVFFFKALENVTMEKREDGYYQVEYIMGKEKRKSKFDITVGSGKKGQSYLSWKNNSLIQMPVTYFTPDSTWSSSPGFNPRRIVFNRVVTSRCLECHSTYFQKMSDEKKHPEEFDKKNIIYGIDCEKCHGPGKEHVNFHTNNPEANEAKYIVNTARSSRQTQLDLCALCHNGRLNKTQPSFSFSAGDKLTDFFQRPDSLVPGYVMDVHGNQLGMLSQSKCFTSSDMTCQSCHNVHKKEQDQLEIFSQRCFTCHSTGKSKLCGLTKSVGSIINKNCIDCHMPKEPSQSIVVYLEGATIPTPAKLRTHYISIYKEETEKVLDFLKSDNAKKAE